MNVTEVAKGRRATALQHTHGNLEALEKLQALEEDVRRIPASRSMVHIAENDAPLKIDIFVGVPKLSKYESILGATRLILVIKKERLSSFYSVCLEARGPGRLVQLSQRWATCTNPPSR
jgi:hypothetical protein